MYSDSADLSMMLCTLQMYLFTYTLDIQVRKCEHRVNYIFAESPVIAGAGERVHGPLLDQTAWHHVGLNVFENLPQDLVTWL